MWFLKRLKPGVADREKKHALATERVNIGTAEGNELVVKCSNHRVGKYHAAIIFKGDCLFLQDNGSRYKTFLKKREDAAFPLKASVAYKMARGDIVSFGCTGMNACDDGKGCFCYRVEREESCHVNPSNDAAQKQNHYESKEKLSKGSEDTRANETCNYKVDVTKEIAQLYLHNDVKNRKPFIDKSYSSDDENSQRHISKETEQVRHNLGEQRPLEKYGNSRDDERGTCCIDENRRVEDSKPVIIEKQKGREAQANERRQLTEGRHKIERQTRLDKHKNTRDEGLCCLDKETALVPLKNEKQKHPQEIESADNARGQYHIDVAREIAQAQRNLGDIRKRAEEIEHLKTKEREDEVASVKLQQVMMAKITPGETIPRERPGREFIKEGFSFSSFNADILEKPSAIKCVNVKDSIRFSQYLRHSLQGMSQDYFFDIIEKERAARGSRELLEYIFFLTSVHQDELIVQCGTDLLLEFNSEWEITLNIVQKILLNWGADINQIVPSSRHPLQALNNNLQTVAEENVIAVLRVLSAQLKVGKSVCEPIFSEKWNEFLFGMLVLLSLDNKYSGCYSHVLDCLRALLDNINDKSNPKWVYEYSKKLLELEADNYNLTSVVCHLLNGSYAAERLRVNTSFAAVQRIMGAPEDKINFQFNWRGRELSRLVKNTTLMALLKPLDIYCLLIFMDIILRHPQITDKPTRRFHEWLERLDPKVGINPHLNALISNYRVLWDVETGT